MLLCVIPFISREDTGEGPFIVEINVLDCDNVVSEFELKSHYIGLVGRVFNNGPGDLGSISGQVIPTTLKMILDTSLLNIQQYKVCIKGKVEQSRERSSALPLHLGVVAIEKGAFCLPSTTVANFTTLTNIPGKSLSPLILPTVG